MEDKELYNEKSFIIGNRVLLLLFGGVPILRGIGFLLSKVGDRIIEASGFIETLTLINNFIIIFVWLFGVLNLILLLSENRPLHLLKLCFIQGFKSEKFQNDGNNKL